MVTPKPCSSADLTTELGAQLLEIWGLLTGCALEYAVELLHTGDPIREIHQRRDQREALIANHLRQFLTPRYLVRET